MKQSLYGRGAATLTVSEPRAERFLRSSQLAAEAMAGWIDRHGLRCVVLMAVLFVPLAVVEAHSHPLLNDEIYTVHIAQAGSLRSMWQMAREIDLHPPLHYMAQRAALALPLPRWLGSRLPSILAGLVVGWSLFWFTAKRLGNLYGMVAVGAFWFGPAVDFAWDNRPYMLWLAFLCLLLLARDAALRLYRRWWAVALVALTTLAMVMTHFLGVACVLPFLAAEGVRARQRGRVDWPLAGALALPTLCGMMCFYQLHHMSENAFPPSRMASLGVAAGMYQWIFANTFFAVSLCALLVVLVFGWDGRREGRGRSQWEGFNDADLMLLTGLMGLPVLMLAGSLLFHLQFWLRYGVAAIPAVGALVAWAIARRLPMGRMVAVAFVIASVGFLLDRAATEWQGPGNAGIMDGGRLPISLEGLDPRLPIVAASPMTFVEMSDREPAAVAQRVFYVTDRQAALQYAHYTLFENEGKIRRMLRLPSNTEDLQPFLAEHGRFYVLGEYDRPEVWLLRKLAADGMTLRYLGKAESTYESADLYLVTR